MLTIKVQITDYIFTNCNPHTTSNFEKHESTYIQDQLPTSNLIYTTFHISFKFPDIFWVKKKINKIVNTATEMMYKTHIYISHIITDHITKPIYL